MINDWTFDENVANRFQKEALAHIPSYEIVIQRSLDIAKLICNKTDNIIDVGSATGYTVKKFIDSGFVNMYGVENSEAMIKKSLCYDKIIYSDKFPKNIYKLVLINWTLHFIQNKIDYLHEVVSCLSNDGSFILTDKLQQTADIKHIYYDFKINNGVTTEYILEKEAMLKNIMFCHDLDYYLNMFSTIGVTYEILHADMGFVTFLCKKSDRKSA